MEDCMAALKRQTYSHFDVLIVDNGSADGSPEYLRSIEGPLFEESLGPGSAGSAAPAVHTIFLQENTGFSGAVNAGIAAAGTEYVVLLNNDTRVHPDYLKELANVFAGDTERRIFAVSPRMIQMYHPELLDDAGDGYNLLGWGFQRGVGRPVNARKFRKAAEIFSACAGAAAYRRSILEEIAYRKGEIYFDPLHFAYLEDLDISFRARIRGYEIVYAPRAKVLHVGSGTSGSKYNAFKVRLAARNNVYLNYKNMPLLMLLFNLPGILAGVGIKQLFFLRRGFGREYAQGFAEGLRTLSKCREHKVRYLPGRTRHYFRIEAMLLRDTFSYIGDFLSRKLLGS